jgi:hypothetical protein
MAEAPAVAADIPAEAVLAAPADILVVAGFAADSPAAVAPAAAPEPVLQLVPSVKIRSQFSFLSSLSSITQTQPYK